MTVQTKDMDMTLHRLRHDDYHEIVGMREEFRTQEPDSRNAYPMQIPDPSGRSDRTAYKFWGTGEYVHTPDGHGTITGFATEDGKITPFARINGRLYHVSVLKHA